MKKFPFVHFGACARLFLNHCGSFAAVVMLCLPLAAQAATLTVDSTADSGDASDVDGFCGTPAPGTCTLRAAIEEANANTDPSNVIMFGAAVNGLGTTVGSDLPDIAKALTIVGPSEGFTVEAAPLVEASFFRYTGSGGTYALRNLTVIGGTAANALGGGCVYFGAVGTSSFTVTNITIQGCTAGNGGPGGGIAVDLISANSHVTLDAVTIGGTGTGEGNTAGSSGGGAWFRLAGTGSMTLKNSTVLGNSATDGGGIAVKRGKLDLYNATIRDNTGGGGIYLDAEGASGGFLRMENTTVSGNTGHGLAFASTNPMASWVTFNTIVGNSLNGIFTDAPGTHLPGNFSFPFTSNIVALNTAGNCNADLNHADGTNSGFNLTNEVGGVPNGCGFDQSSDRVLSTTAHVAELSTLAEMKLGSLADNPDPPNTHALLAGSPAIDNGNAARVNATTLSDARGADAQDGDLDLDSMDGDPLRDIGAYEFGGFGLVQFLFPDANSIFTVDEDESSVDILIRRYGDGTAAVTTPIVALTDDNAGTATDGTCGGGGNSANDYTFGTNPLNFTFASSGGGLQFDQVATVTICDNNSATENTEEFNIFLNKAAAGDSVGYDIGPLSHGEVEIADTDNGVFQFNPRVYDETFEGNPGSDGSLNLTITRTPGSKGEVRVNYATRTGTSCSGTACTATAGTDYTSVTSFVDFANEEMSKTIPISFVGDEANEADETFEVQLTGVSCQNLPAGRNCDARLEGGANSPNRTADVTILDDDAPLPGSFEFELESYKFNESTLTATVRVLRVGGSDGEVSVEYGKNDGTATSVPGPGQDYFFDPAPPANRTLTWEDGEATAQTFTVNLVADNLPESHESFELTLSNPLNLEDPAGPTPTINTDSVPVTLVSATQPTVAFSSSSYTVDEATSNWHADNGELKVTISPFEGEDVEVSFYTVNGSALSLADFVGRDQENPFTTTFSASMGAQERTISTINFPGGFMISSDGMVEGNETFDSVLLPPTEYGADLGAQSSTTVTIVDPAAVRLIEPPVFRSNHEGNGGLITVTAERVGDDSAQVMVNFAISECTVPTVAPACAEETIDYTRPGGFTGTLTWPAGELGTQSFTITVIGDTLIEGDEEIAVELAETASMAEVGTPRVGQAIITDDDYEFVINDSSISVAEDGTPATIEVQRVGSTLGPASLDFSTADGTAEAESDFTDTSATLSWSNGESGSKIASIPVIDDAVDEPDETFTVAFANAGANASGQIPSVTGSPVTVEIGDLDSVAVSFEVASQTTVEGASVTVTAVRAGDSAFDITIPFTVSGTAVNPADHDAVSGSITILSTNSTGSTTFNVVDDGDDEDDETIVFTMGAPTGGTVSAVAPTVHTVTINDDDATYTIDNVTVTEGNTGTVTATFNVTRSAHTAATTVEFDTADVTATAGTDYVTNSGELSFPASSSATVRQVRVTVNGDEIAEGDETFTVTLSNASEGVIVTDTGIGTIGDDDALEYSINDVSVIEDDGTLPLPVVATFTVTRTASATETTVDYTTVAVTATEGVDYEDETGTLTFPASPSDSTMTFDVTITADTLDEDDETFNAVLSNATAGGTIVDNTGLGTIIDNDTTSYSIGDVNVTEGDSGVLMATFVVTRTPAGRATTIDFTTVPGTATEGVDYDDATGTLTFPASAADSTQTIEVTINGDRLDEADEGFSVLLSNASGDGTIDDDTGDGTIVDDDAVTVSFAATGQSVDESDGAVTVTVIRAGNTTFDITVPFTVSGTANNPDDHSAADGSVTILAGQPSATTTFSIVDDDRDESIETVLFTLGTPTGGDVSVAEPSSHNVSINDDDAVTVAFNSAGQTVLETGTVTVTAIRSGDTDFDITIPFTVSGTATNPADHNAVDGSITILAGDTTGTSSFDVDEDGVDESDETVIFTMGTPTGGNVTAVAPTEHTVTINDNDATYTIDNVTVTEGDSGTTTATFTVTRSPHGAQTTIEYVTAAGTATEDTDYQAATGTLTFPVSGATTTQTIDVLVNGDTVDEGDETFTVTLSNASEGAIADGTGEGTILDDDSAGYTIDDVSVTEGDSDLPLPVTVTFTVTRTGSSQATTVDYSTLGVTATQDVDYQGTSGTLSFDASDADTTQTVEVTINADTVDEPDETFEVTLGNASGGTVVDATGIGTIIDDDTGVTVSFAAPSQSVSEDAGQVTVTVERQGETEFDITVPYSVSGTAANPADHDASAGSVVIASGQASASFTFEVVDDPDDETDETVIFTLGAPNGGDVAAADPSEHTVTIVDNEATVSFAAASQTVNEGDGTVTVTVTSTGADFDISVPVNLIGGSALNPDDHDAASGTIVIPANQTQGSLTFNLVDDARDESAETVLFALGTPTGSGGTAELAEPTAHTVNIMDNDAVTVSFDADSQSVDESAGTFIVTIQRNGDTDFDITVPYTVSGTAANPDDHNAADGSVVIRSGEPIETVTFTVVEDALNEDNETVVFTLGTPTGGTVTAAAPAEHTVTVTDNDTATYSINDVVVTEGNTGTTTATFTVTRTPSALAGSVAWATAAGTATAGEDYVDASGTLNFSPSSSDVTQTFDVTINGDTVDEPEETFTVELSNATGGVIANGTGTGTIGDDDGVTVSFDVDSQSVNEGDGTVTVTVVRTGATTSELTVPVTISGTAVNPGDHDAADGSVVIPASGADSESVDFTFTLVDDATNEPSETVVLALGTPVGGDASRVSPSEHTVTITDDDVAPTVSLSIADSPLAEDGGVATVTATLDAASGQNVVVNFAFAGVAVRGADYAASAVSITIPAGTLEGSITLTGTDDTLFEGDEDAAVSIDTVENATVGSPESVIATVIDDDSPPFVTLSLSGDPFAEAGGVATVTATLSNASTQDVTVELAFSGSATLDVDYSASATSILVPAESTSAAITLTGLTDAMVEGNETVTAAISNVTNGTAGTPDSVTATITDADVLPSVSLSLAGSPFVEKDGVATVTATLSHAHNEAVTVNLGFTGTATQGTDYTVSGSSITIPAGSLSGTATLTGRNDKRIEDDETIQVSINTVTNGTTGSPSSVTATITSEDLAGADKEAALAIILTGNGVATSGSAGALPWPTLGVLLMLGALRRRRSTLMAMVAALGLCVPATGSAADLSYNFADLRYVSAKIDDPSVSASGFGFSGSWLTSKDSFVFGGFGSASTDEFDVQGTTGSTDSTSFSLGAGYRRAVGEQGTDFNATLSLISAKAEGQGGFSASASDTGYALGLGFRGSFSDTVEWGATYDYFSLFDDSSSQLSLQTLFKVGAWAQIGIGAGFGSSSNQYNAGLRILL